jgi:gamma-glutamyltranspeptidase/glutathione hydrolase
VPASVIYPYLSFGNALEVEPAVPDGVHTALRSMGHEVQAVPTVAGGMNGIQFDDDGWLAGAACGRHADRVCRRVG